MAIQLPVIQLNQSLVDNAGRPSFAFTNFLNKIRETFNANIGDFEKAQEELQKLLEELEAIKDEIANMDQGNFQQQIDEINTQITQLQFEIDKFSKGLSAYKGDWIVDQFPEYIYGDTVLYNGVVWFSIITEPVSPSEEPTPSALTWVPFLKRLDALEDVDLTTLATDDVLTWDGTSWTNAPVLLALDDLTDVDTTGVTDGQALIYDDATDTWIPGDVSSTIAGADDYDNTTPATDGQVIAWSDTLNKFHPVDATEPAINFAVQAVGTGVSQNITLPVADLTVDDVEVFVNASYFPTAEYSITGTTLTMTSNAAGDAIEIRGAGFAGGGGGGGASALSDLTDVDITTVPPTDGQALVYDAGSSLWIASDVAAGGGGSSLTSVGYMDVNQFRPNAGVGFGSGNFGGRVVVFDRDATVTHVSGYCVTTNATTQVRPALYSVDPTNGNIQTLLVQGPQVTGITRGMFDLALASEYEVSAGTLLYVGFQVLVSNLVLAQVGDTIDTYFFGASGSLPSTAPGASYGGATSMTIFPKVKLGGVTGATLTSKPSLSEFTYYGEGTTTLTSNNNGLMLTTPIAVALNNNNTRLAACERPSTALPWERVFQVEMNGQKVRNFLRYGIGLYDPTSTAYIGIQIEYNSFASGSFFYLRNLALTTLINTSTTDASALQGTQVVPQRLNWFKISYTGTEYVFWGSDTGMNWMEVYRVTASTYATYTKLGFHSAPRVESGSLAYPMTVQCSYYADKAPVSPLFQTALDGSKPWYWKPPMSGQFTNVFGTGTYSYTDDTDVGLIYQLPAQAVAGPRGASQALPAGDWSVTMKMSAQFRTTGTANIGMTIHNAAKDRYYLFGWDARRWLHFLNYSNTAWGSYEVASVMNQEVDWYKMEFNYATNVLTVTYSNEGKIWLPFATVNTSSYLGGSPTGIGFSCLNEGYSAYPVVATVEHWKTSF